MGFGRLGARRLATASAIAVMAWLLPGMPGLAQDAPSAFQAENWADHADSDGATPGQYDASRAICRKLGGVEMPAADRPTAAELDRLEGCDAEALLYGLGRPADARAARLCAYRQATTKDETGSIDSSRPYAGLGLLVAIYANGFGVRQNLDVAISLACRVEGADAETDARVLRLADPHEAPKAMAAPVPAPSGSASDLAANPASEAAPAATPEAEFTLCTDLTSGSLMGECAAHDETVAASRRDATLARLTAGLEGRQRDAYAALRASLDAFVTARGDREVDGGGTMAPSQVIGDGTQQRDAFATALAGLDRAGRAGAPPADAAGAKAADATLNATYRKAIGLYPNPEKTGDDTGPTGPTADNIRATQRAWLRYRDAFVAYARLRYPSVAADGLVATLTKRRSEDLANLVEQASPN